MDEGADARALREKYEAMLALRVAHERARTDPRYVEPDPREAMMALAARFPGALREIDELPLATIRARIDELLEVEREGARAASWMIAQARFHRLARGALATKRWLAKRKSATAALEAAFARAIAEGAVADDALLWAGALEAIARPPRGRVTDVVFARLARDLAMDEVVVRDLVFGPPRRPRR